MDLTADSLPGAAFPRAQRDQLLDRRVDIVTIPAERFRGLLGVLPRDLEFVRSVIEPEFHRILIDADGFNRKYIAVPHRCRLNIVGVQANDCVPV